MSLVDLTTIEQPEPGAVSSARVGYLGPRGTFTEEALLDQGDLAGGDTVTMGSIPAVLDAVHDGGLDLGFVALENSIGGAVDASLDGLIFGHRLLIQREAVHDIRLSLVAPHGTRLGDVRQVVSFPHALAQCRGFLRDELDHPVAEVAASSTAEAARDLGDRRESGTAAVSTTAAARLYGLDVLATDIQDSKENRTRFVLVGRPAHGIPAATGHDKTTIVCFQQVDRPGSLYSMLEQFAIRELNVTKIESRPTKAHLGEYCFVIDLDGHVGEDRVADCLWALGRQLPDVKFLGSYPSTDPTRAGRRKWSRPRTATVGRWIDALRANVRPAGGGLGQSAGRDGGDRGHESHRRPTWAPAGRPLALNVAEG
jgi:prephenate dehydratase